MQNYILLEVICEAAKAEILTAEMELLEYEGFLETEQGFEAFIPKEDFALEPVLALLERYQLSSNNLTYKEVAQQNWNAEWESDFEPVSVGNSLRIRAPFHPADDSYHLELVIQPKTSFGTGHHETTHTIMELLLESNLNGKTVFDFGSGTGILAILAMKLGATSVFANDIDSWAAENIFENMALNQVENISFVQGDLSVVEGKKFDVLLANINRNILMESFAALKNCMNPEATLFISGFYESDLPDLIQQASKSGLTLQKRVIKNNWAAALLT